MKKCPIPGWCLHQPESSIKCFYEIINPLISIASTVAGVFAATSLIEHLSIRIPAGEDTSRGGQEKRMKNEKVIPSRSRGDIGAITDFFIFHY